MKLRKAAALVLVTVMAATVLTGCGKGNTGEGETKGADREKALDLRTLTQDEIEEGAKKEGRVSSVGMPDEWAHWDLSWASILEKYGLEHDDVDLSSGEEIATFVAEKDDPTKDVGDVGYAFTSTAMDEGCLQPYKVSSWDSIPDWAKDPDGNWTVSYTGTTCFIFNDAAIEGELPTTWQELMDSEIVVNMGNVVGGASSQANILACAIAMGGGFDNVQPGIDYFKKLAEQGRIHPSEGQVSEMVSGEVECFGGRFDFNGTAWADEYNAQELEGLHITTVIPQDGAITTGYALIINKWAPHPHAAAQTVEYMLSEEGQIERAYGGARPIRSDVEIPEDAPVLGDEWYENTTSPESADALQEACDEIARLWEEEVIPLLG
ncbi:ABC transporter substrate-binding protein [Ruminococcus gauvreauii]|uniref:Extracellular solute-binding protein n=1 Tax=Ruminococcus gauvreauii TaxID=438033 RepID=A0ABY5VKC5_9FIRM|nr:extracellular solute-binding protein [Ruminococcus gauvreauii]UWP60503.1 extracellular solute-binding protein [Ruminococcus gauvreauii]